MINKISIKNFQSHKDTSITFCKGLNVITGTSDSGKSAILRSLRWVLDNKPSGDSIRNWDCSPKEPVEVSIQFSEGTEIKKERVLDKATYFCNTLEQSLTFKAVKSDVPQEILDITNLSEFNTQTQHEPYFLLTDSPGERARKLNDLVGLGVIDSLFKNLNSRTLDTKRKIEETIKIEETLAVQIEKLDYLEDVEKLIQKIEKNQKEHVFLFNKRKEILNCITQLLFLNREIDKVKSIIVFEDRCSKILSNIEKLKKSKIKMQSVKSLVSSINEMASKIENESSWLEVEEPYNLLVKKKDSYISKRKSLLSIKEVVINLLLLAKEEKMGKIKLELQQKEYESILLEHKICPTCGSPVSKEKIEEILK
jgi:DNA repair protein SbcC/Rad50